MTSLRIAQLAERSGVPATTLRYYEEIGLLVPAGRSPNGYRAYSQRDVERLRFITRAKRLDLSLEELRELVIAWDGQDCGDVQERMAQIVGSRLAQTQDRVADLIALAGQLQAAAARLAGPVRPGPCDDACACSTASGAEGPTFVPLTRVASTALAAPPSVGSTCAEPAVPVIACSLDVGTLPDRAADWQAVLGRATPRGPIPGGLTMTFANEPDLVADLARLAAAEQACCTFFEFTLTITGGGVRFEVRAPSEARDVLMALFGPSGADA